MATPSTGTGKRQITNQGQTASAKHASDPKLSARGDQSVRDLNISTKAE
jgi:hypothetical protein